MTILFAPGVFVFLLVPTLGAQTMRQSAAKVNFYSVTDSEITEILRTITRQEIEDRVYKRDGSLRLAPLMHHLQGSASNTKLRKSNARQQGKPRVYFSLTLAPGDLSGHEVCASRSEACARACALTQGLAAVFSTIQTARANLTRAVMERATRVKTIREIIVDCLVAQMWAEAQGAVALIRLNTGSDLLWWTSAFFQLIQRVVNFCWQFEISPPVFYDYSKHVRGYTDRVKRIYSKDSHPHHENAGSVPWAHYNVTLSRSETNESEIVEALELGFNAAIPFYNPGPPMLSRRSAEILLPTEWTIGEHTYRVHDGDIDDGRHPITGDPVPFSGGPGAIIGLRLKEGRRELWQHSVSSGFGVMFDPATGPSLPPLVKV